MKRLHWLIILCVIFVSFKAFAFIKRQCTEPGCSNECPGFLGSYCSTCQDKHRCRECSKPIIGYGLCYDCRYYSFRSIQPTGSFEISSKKGLISEQILDSPSRRSYGRGKAAIGTLLLALGALLFIDYPAIGVIVIILGLICFYYYYKAKEAYYKKKQKNSKKEKEELSSKISSSKKDSDSNNDENKGKRLRPTRASSTLTELSSKSLSTVSSDKIVTKNEDKKNELVAASQILTNKGAYWYKEGVLYCNGHDGRAIDYHKAIECFEKSKNCGWKDAESSLNYLQNFISKEG